MAKRPIEEVVDGQQAYLKRQKITNAKPVNAGPALPEEETSSGKQLQRLLTFSQNAARLKQGISAV